MANYTFTTLDDPSATGGTFAQGMNDAGILVGYYVNNNGADIPFTYSAGAFSTYSPSTFTASTLEGINDSDEVVGSDVWTEGNPPTSFMAGFMGNFSGSKLAAQDEQPSNFCGVNSSDTWVGYNIKNNVATGFFGGLQGQGGTISYSGATDTYAHGINDDNEIAGYFIGTDPNQASVSTAHGFSTMPGRTPISTILMRSTAPMRKASIMPIRSPVIISMETPTHTDLSSISQRALTRPST